MPEGDIVYRAARLLDRSLSGDQLTRSDFRVPQHATADLAGGTVIGTVSRGKHLLTRVDRDIQHWTLHTHLKMEGAWQVLRPDQPWPRPAHQARVVLETADAVAVGFSLGVVELLDRDSEEQVVGHLGPDLLGPDWDEDEALRRLTTDPDRPVVEALLDQRNLAGIGNMYAAELCFIAGLHPATPVAEAPDLRRTVRRAKEMLQVGVRQRPRPWVYRRDRSPCRRCGTPVEVELRGAAGRERASYWCPSCQPTR